MRPFPLLQTVARPRSTVVGLFAGLYLFIAGGIAGASDAPTITTEANAPGVISINYYHSGIGAIDLFYIQRFGDGRIIFSSHEPNDQHLDMNLIPNTVYSYRACAIYQDQVVDSCSDFIDERTMQPPAPPPSYQPPSITSTQFTTNAITVTWGPTGEYNSVFIQLSDTLGNVDQRELPNTPGAGRSFTFGGLRSGAVYRIILKGCSVNVFGGAGCGPWSPDEFVTTETEELSPPPLEKPQLSVIVETSFNFLDLNVRIYRSQGPGIRYLFFRNGEQILEMPLDQSVFTGPFVDWRYVHKDPTFGARRSYHVCLVSPMTQPQQVCSDVVLVRGLFQSHPPPCVSLPCPVPDEGTVDYGGCPGC